MLNFGKKICTIEYLFLKIPYELLQVLQLRMINDHSYCLLNKATNWEYISSLTASLLLLLSVNIVAPG